ncbi:MAG: M20 family metallopeptidase [Anaerolineae bacterium]
MAELVSSTMRDMGYDDVSVDAAGNVLGWIAGGSEATIMLHAHMDVVDPGPADAWTHGPWEGGLRKGRIWGRGAVDDKGSLVAQLIAGGLMVAHGLRPAGDVLVAAVVGEETGGLGTLTLREDLDVDLAIVGEPSSGRLMRGHRGRFELVITFRGRSAHASAPHLGRNPHFSLARFVERLDRVTLACDAVLGTASLAPTIVTCDQTSSNVIPSRLSLSIDWRSVPAEDVESARLQLQRLADASCEEGVTADIVLRELPARSYTGLERMIPYVVPSFVVPADDRALVVADRLLGEAVGHDVAVDVWGFATDGGYLVQAGIPCLGYGPGDPRLAHVVDESIEVAELVEATAGYLGLAMFLGGRIA